MSRKMEQVIMDDRFQEIITGIWAAMDCIGWERREYVIEVRDGAVLLKVPSFKWDVVGDLPAEVIDRKLRSMGFALSSRSTLMTGNETVVIAIAPWVGG